MDEKEAQAFIIEHTSVTRQKVTIAKAFILSHFNEDTIILVNSFIEHMDAKAPSKVVLHQSIDPLSDLKQVSNSVVSLQAVGRYRNKRQEFTNGPEMVS